MSYSLVIHLDSFDATEQAQYADLHHGKAGVNEDTDPTFLTIE